MKLGIGLSQVLKTYEGDSEGGALPAYNGAGEALGTVTAAMAATRAVPVIACRLGAASGRRIQSDPVIPRLSRAWIDALSPRHDAKKSPPALRASASESPTELVRRERGGVSLF